MKQPKMPVIACIASAMLCFSGIEVNATASIQNLKSTNVQS